MAIVIECSACGKQYNADEAMVGRRVKCRGCGQVILVTRSDSDVAADVDLDALAQLEQSYSGQESAGVGPVRHEPVIARSNTGQDYALEGERVEAIGRANYRFNFPMARQIDQWGPLLLVLLGVAAVAGQIFSTDETGSIGLGIVRLALLLLFYGVIVMPLTVIAIRAAARKLRFQLPRAAKWRTFASFMPAFALAVVFWLIGGSVGGLILGAILGAALSCMALWLLLRLRAEELPTTAAHGTTAFLASAALTAGIIFGMNFVLVQVLERAGQHDVLPGSPFSRYLVWVEPVEEAPAAPVQPPRPIIIEPPQVAQVDEEPPPAPEPEKTVVPAEPVQVTQDPPQDQRPEQVPATESPLVADVTAAAEVGAFREIIHPATPSPFVAVIKAGQPDQVELWDTRGSRNGQGWRKLGSTSFNTIPGMSNRYVLSADGDLLARLTNFPRLAVQVWSFSRDSIATTIDLSSGPAGATPELLGFALPIQRRRVDGSPYSVGGPRVLMRWAAGANTGIQLFDVTTNDAPKSLNTLRFSGAPGSYALSPDGQRLAIPGRMQPLRQPAGQYMAIYDLDDVKVPPTPLPVTHLAVDVPPTGIAWSGDGTKLAALFEQHGNGLLVAWNVSARQTLASYEFPSGPVANADRNRFAGSSIHWLPGDNGWLIYGQGVFDEKTGRRLGDIGIGKVVGHHIAPDGTCYLMRTAGNQHSLAAVHLNLTAIESHMAQVRAPAP